MRLLLVRHAEANRQGSEDLGLTTKGRSQAERLAAALSQRGDLQVASRILVSPARRAQETADLTVPKANLQPETHAPFSEMRELPPLGSNSDEDFPAFLGRVSAAINTLAAQHSGETVLAITHSGVVVASVISLFGIPRPGTGARLEPSNCSVTEWLYNQAQWTLKGFNIVL